MNPTIAFPVCRGSVLIDEADLPLVAPYRWYLNGNARWYYAARWEGSRAGGAKRTLILMHRVLAEAPFGISVDHVNGNRLDNRRANLRLCTQAENLRNQSSHRGSRSRFKGVYWDHFRDQWRAEIRADGRKYSLGRFDNQEDAARTYDGAAIRLHGAFARLNFPEPEP